jgi:hypothetical protein
MTTVREWICPDTSCHFKENTNSLFETLLEYTEGNRKNCPEHKECELQLTFPFGLGAKDNRCTVLDCFTIKEPEQWSNNGSVVKFYPFLVILKRHNKNTAVWLPYWHVVDGKKKKYGQWAPFMNMELFMKLLSQAKRKGYINIEDGGNL